MKQDQLLRDDHIIETDKGVALLLSLSEPPLKLFERLFHV